MLEIIKMIDDLVATLKQEQEDDENQKEWCQKEFDVSEAPGGVEAASVCA